MPSSITPVRADFIPVVLGGDVGAYALSREFHEAYGIKSIAMGTGFIGAIAHSKIVELYHIDSYTAKPLLLGLEAVHAQHQKQRIVLVANTDQLIEVLESLYEDLPAYVSCTIPPRTAFDAVYDKDVFSKLCHKHGLETPHTELVHLAGTDPIEPVHMPFPVVAKPAVSADYYHTLIKGFKKVYYITTQMELDELWQRLRHANFAGDFLVQELIGGDDTYMDSLTLYIGRNGKPRLLGAAQVLLEDHAPTMLGNPVAMIIRKKQELWKRTAALLADVGYRGFVNFDVKRDPITGREIFLDCNPRMGRNSYYNVAGGVNPMEILIRDSIDEVNDEVQVACKPALYTLVPLSLLHRYVRNETLTAEINDLIRRKLVFNPQRYAADRGVRRMIDVELTEKNQIRKFTKYYPEATNTSF